MKFHIKTYGCQMNERDSESVAGLLIKRGYVQAAGEASADVIIINTCSVRAKAEDKAIGKLRLISTRSKRRSRRLIVGAIGCMVQRLKEDIKSKVPAIDFAIAPRSLAMLPDVIEAVVSGRGPIIEIDDNTAPDDLKCHLDGQISAFVNILFGCDRHCAYCVVPMVRGSEWSRQGDSIVGEVKELVKKGVKEVTLLGQSVMSYGRKNQVWPGDHHSDNGFKEPFARLLEAVCGVKGIKRIRFTSGHPSGITDELVTAMKHFKPICEHLHLPMQSGSDRILKLMRRGYTSDDYRRAVERLRDAVPGIFFTTDIIVGFPGETEEDFEMTRRFMDEIGFDNAYIFKYSPRPGTPAEKMDDDVPENEKMSRNKILLIDQDRRGLKINHDLIGSIQEVMVEGKSLRNEARWSGRTRTNKIVIFDPESGMKEGDLVDVLIEKAREQTLYGKVKKTGGR